MQQQAKKVMRIVVISVFLGALLPSLPASAVPQASSGAIQIDGLVAGPPPATPPTIESPAPDTTFTTKSITVKGSCIVNLVVKLYRNGFFAGSALCQSDGKYSVPIDLYVGKNDLVARQFDIANQSSPDSNKVAVFYTPTQSPTLPDKPADQSQPKDPPTTQIPGETPTGTAQFQLVIEYDYTLQSILVDSPFRLPVTFAGGTSPYAVNINWGDGTNDVFSRQDTTPFNTDHTYAKTGYYTATIAVSDKNNNKASLQFVLFVSGTKKVTTPANSSTENSNETWWQVTQIGILTTGIVASFLLGRYSRRPVRS